MKTRLMILIFSILSLGEINANPVNEEYRTFNSIEVRNSAIVYVSKGEETSSRIDETENRSDMNVSLITNKNKVLIIDSPDKDKDSKPAVIYITIKDLKKIRLTGTGSIIMLNEIDAEELEVNNSGSGTIQANIITKKVKIKLSGSGDIDIKGKTNNSDIKINGSGNLDAVNLKTKICTVSSTGSGTGTVDVDHDLTINITGSGNVYVVKYPEKMYSKSNGTGKVELLKA